MTPAAAVTMTELVDSAVEASQADWASQIDWDGEIAAKCRYSSLHCSINRTYKEHLKNTGISHIL